MLGLGSALCSRDVDRAPGVARRITSGMPFANAVVASDPRARFGGTNSSGYGRELGMAALRGFASLRIYWAAG